MRTYKTMTIMALTELFDVLREMHLTLGDEPKDATRHAESEVCLRMGLCIDQFHKLMDGEDI